MDQNGPKWTKMDQNGHNWMTLGKELDQMGLDKLIIKIFSFGVLNRGSIGTYFKEKRTDK